MLVKGVSKKELWPARNFFFKCFELFWNLDKRTRVSEDGEANKGVFFDEVMGIKKEIYQWGNWSYGFLNLQKIYINNYYIVNFLLGLKCPKNIRKNNIFIYIRISPNKSPVKFDFINLLFRGLKGSCVDI